MDDITLLLFLLLKLNIVSLHSFERILYMKLPFFASFIVFCIWLGYEIHKHRNLEAKSYDDFWQKENQANSTRKKPLDDLAYISIPLDTFPFSLFPENEQVAEYQQIIRELSTVSIVNLTGISNTDLKLRYGAANIDVLSLYDQRYTTLVRVLQDWAFFLYQSRYPTEAKVLLEFAVRTCTDIYASYELLIKIYEEGQEASQITKLLPYAQQIHSISQKRILALLEEHSAHTADRCDQ